MKRLKLSLCALGCLTAFGPTWAATSSVQVDHVRVQLIDLDPDDGITPAFSVFSAMTTVRVFEQYTQVATFSDPVGPFSAGNANIFSTAGSLGGDLFGSGWSAMASSGTQVVGRGGDATVHLDIGFMVTPKTLVLVTTDAPVLQTSSPGPYEFALAETRLSVSGSGKYYSSAYVGMPYYPNSSYPLQASFVNVASAAAYGYLDLQIHSHTFDAGSPVPEPQTAVLLMAGLGITAVAARRRRG